MMQRILGLCLLFFFHQLEAQHACALAKQTARNNSRSSVVSPYFDALQAKYDVKFYFLDLQASNRDNYISGSVYSKAVVTAASVDTFLAEIYSGMTIDSVFVQNQRVAFSRSGQAMVVALPTALSAGTLLETKIYYRGNSPSSGGFFDGYSNGVSGRWGNRASWSLSQPFYAYHWWPCKQALKDKIDSSWVFITTDDTLMAGSNGMLTQVTPLPNNKKRYEWKSNNPIDYYLISIAIANYVEYTNYANIPGLPPVPIQNFVYNNPMTLPTFKPELDTIPLMLEYFSELFGAYPFANEKYGHCMAPFSGGMEHQTMTTQGFFEFTLNAHELGHQWFGDNVTCATWNDIFVNEGFASYLEYLALARLRSYTAAQSQMASVHNSVMSSSGGSVYNPDSTSDSRIFDSRLSYDKGAAVIHTMRYLIANDSLFFAGLRAYQQNYGDGTATIDDLKNTMQTHSGKNLTDFFDEWIYGQGYPTYSVEYNQLNGYTKAVVKHQTSTAVTTLFTNDISLRFRRTGLTDTIVRFAIQSNSDTFLFPLNGTIQSVQVDPDNWVINSIGAITRNTALVIEIAGIEDNQSAYFNISPNPVSDRLYIKTDAERPQYEILDVCGKIVLQGILYNNHIDCNHLNTGVYVLTIKNNGASHHCTFLKK